MLDDDDLEYANSQPLVQQFFFCPKMQITEVRQLERCFEVTLSVRLRVFKGLDGVGVLIFAVIVITILTPRFQSKVRHPALNPVRA